MGAKEEEAVRDFIAGWQCPKWDADLIGRMLDRTKGLAPEPQLTMPEVMTWAVHVFSRSVPATSANPTLPASRTPATSRFQVARATWGHLVWFTSEVVLPLGGWVRCPDDGPTSVRDITGVDAIPIDALAGSSFWLTT